MLTMSGCWEHHVVEEVAVDACVQPYLCDTFSGRIVLNVETELAEPEVSVRLDGVEIVSGARVIDGGRVAGIDCVAPGEHELQITVRSGIADFAETRTIAMGECEVEITVTVPRR